HRHLHAIRPGYQFGFRWLPFLIGCVYTIAWAAVLVRLRKGPLRPVVAWAAGITAMWALLAVLFVRWADNVKSYRSVFGEPDRALPKSYDCIASRGLGLSQRASLHYFTGLLTQREESPARRRTCDLLLVQGALSEEAAPAGWRRIWEGH